MKVTYTQELCQSSLYRSNYRSKCYQTLKCLSRIHFTRTTKSNPWILPGFANILAEAVPHLRGAPAGKGLHIYKKQWMRGAKLERTSRSNLVHMCLHPEAGSLLFTNLPLFLAFWISSVSHYIIHFLGASSKGLLMHSNNSKNYFKEKDYCQMENPR